VELPTIASKIKPVMLDILSLTLIDAYAQTAEELDELVSSQLLRCESSPCLLVF
jgi:hypothetical protein